LAARGLLEAAAGFLDCGLGGGFAGGGLDGCGGFSGCSVSGLGGCSGDCGCGGGPHHERVNVLGERAGSRCFRHYFMIYTVILLTLSLEDALELLWE
jgi:hypothetical protein